MAKVSRVFKVLDSIESDSSLFKSLFTKLDSRIRIKYVDSLKESQRHMVRHSECVQLMTDEELQIVSNLYFMETIKKINSNKNGGLYDFNIN